MKNPTHVHSSTFGIAETAAFRAAVALAASITGESKRHPDFLSIQSSNLQVYETSLLFFCYCKNQSIQHFFQDWF